MAETKKGKGKKHLGLPLWGWAAVGGGTLTIYYLYRRHVVSSTAATTTALTGGSEIPTDVESAATTATTGSYATLAAYEQALLDQLTGSGTSGADALNGISNWLNGNCVTSTQYSALSNAITNGNIGLPPGYSTVPTLSVCSTSSGATTSGTTATTTGTGTDTSTGTTAATVNQYASEVLQGGGYWTPNSETPVVASNGGSYTWLPDWASAQSLAAGGHTVYYQPAEGVFEPFPVNNPPPETGNTPLYVSAS